MATNALTVRTNDLPAPSEWATIMEMGKVLHQSGILPTYIKSPAAAVAIIQKGREVGVPPMAAIAGISFVQGRATMGAELMHACILRDHGSTALFVRESTDKFCTVSYTRPGLPTMEFTFTYEMATKAGLTTGGSGMYAKYPAAMLRSRAISYVAKMAFPDSIGGMYTPEEMGAEVEVDDSGTMTVRVVPESAPAQIAAPSLPFGLDRDQWQRLVQQAADAGVAIDDATDGEDVGRAITRNVQALGKTVDLPAPLTAAFAYKAFGRIKQLRAEAASAPADEAIEGEVVDEAALEPIAAPAPPQRIGANDVTRVWTVARGAGWSTDQVHGWIEREYPYAKGIDGNPSVRELRPADLHRLLDELQGGAENDAALDAKLADARA